MASIINAATSGGLVTTADTSGILQLQTAGTTAVTVDASQRVGIGTATPAYNLDVARSGNGVSARFSQGSFFTYIYSGSAASYFSADTGALTSYGLTASTLQMSAGNGGDQLVVSQTSVKPNVLLDISGGSAGRIQFPATQNASADANTLDDYEEGTFTPAYNAAYGSFTSITYGLQSGKYTKVGNMVSINIYIYTSAVTVGTANTGFTMTGLPFTASADSACSLAKLFSWNFGAVTKPINASIGASGTLIYFFNGAYDDTFSSGNYVFGFQGGTADRHFINLTSTYFV